MSCLKLKNKKCEKCCEKGKKRAIGNLFFTKPNKPSKPVDKPSVHTPPAPPTPPASPAPVKESKKAILIGLNYPGSYYSLNGCVNDVKNGDEFLKAHGYDSKFLDDSGVSLSYDVLDALDDLRKSDSKKVFFHYSGHGTQVDDYSGDEADGKDEALYSKDGHLIVDDDINTAVSRFGADKKVTLVFDCCHSGTIVDLPYILTLSPENGGVKEEKVKKGVKARVIALSGCKDSQTSSDITSGGISYGALSNTFYSILRDFEKSGKKVTWRQLYETLLVEMTKKRYSQVPQITASDPSLFDEVVSF